MVPTSTDDPGINLPICISQNIRGLALSNKHARPYSNDGRWLSLSAIAAEADIISLSETQVEETGFASHAFSPFGKRLKPMTYSSAGKSSGLYVFVNPLTIKNYSAAVLERGRLLRINFDFNEAAFCFYALYLSSSNPTHRLNSIATLSTDLNAQSILFLTNNKSPNFILAGDLNLHLKDSNEPASAAFLSAAQSARLIDVHQSLGVSEPTRMGDGLRSAHSSTIDFIFASDFLQYKSAQTTFTAQSDHAVLRISPTPPQRPPPPCPNPTPMSSKAPNL